MSRRLSQWTMTTAAIALTAASIGAANTGTPLMMNFNDGVDGWRVVVDGVMGGRSSGRVNATDSGTLDFSGNLSLENNGGFSQMRTNVSGDAFADADGVVIKVLGDGRTYKFDVRCSNVRLMAGGFQQDFETREGEWTTIQLPFDDFRLYSFGRRVPNAPELTPTLIESIGVTLADKKSGPFRLEIDSIGTFGSEAGGSADTASNDLASVARAAGLNTLLDLVAAAELDLPANERVTIFAPTDEAFAAIPEDTREFLLKPEGRETLRAILTYHVTIPALKSSDLLSRRSISTLNGQRLSIDAAIPASIGGANLVAVDVPFDGGMVHVVDQVLMPELETIGQVAAASDQLGTLSAAVSAAGLGDQLSSEDGPWTVFAPVDAAFDALPSGALDELLAPENRSRLVETLGLHVVPGRLYSNELLSSDRALTFFGQPIEFKIESGGLRAENASIVKADIEAANGVIHLIDAVILPAESETYSASASMEAARLCEMAISRGAPLYNAGQVSACATIYEITLEAMLAFAAEDLGRDISQRIQQALAEAENDSGWSERAWTYRRALDEIYPRLTRRGESMATVRMEDEVSRFASSNTPAGN